MDSLNCKSSLDSICQYGDQIAAVVIEPIMGNCGSIAATDERKNEKSVMTMPVCLSLTR